MLLFGRGAKFDDLLRTEIVSLIDPDTPISYLDDDRVRVGDLDVDVAPLRAHWTTLSRTDRAPWLQALLPTLLAPPDIPQRLGTTRLLRPGLRPRAQAEVARLHHLADGIRRLPKRRPLLPHRSIGGDIVSVLLWDHPTASAMIDQDQLDRWGARFDDLIDVAVDNLSDLPSTGWASDDNRLWTAGAGEPFGASRMLNPEFLGETGIVGDVVALLPDQCTVLATSVDDAIGIQALCQRGIEIATNGRPLSLRPLVGRPGRWRHLQLTPSHPAVDPLRRLSLLNFEAQYRILRPVLEELLGRDLTLGGYEIRVDDRGDWHSATSWPASSATLLPRTDVVDLIIDDGRTVTTPWTMLRQLLGPSMEHTSHYPEMWRMDRFPTTTELHRLRA